ARRVVPCESTSDGDIATSLADARDLKPSSEGTQLNGPSRQWQIAGRSLPLGQMLECQSQPRALTYHARDERAYISGITFPLGRNDDRHSASATVASGPVCRRSGWRGPIIRLSASGLGRGVLHGLFFESCAATVQIMTDP